MSALTPERIAEIVERARCANERFLPFGIDEQAELCRLALLGLRVEGAPVTWAIPLYLESGQAICVNAHVPAGWLGKRVRLVVEDEEGKL